MTKKITADEALTISTQAAAKTGTLLGQMEADGFITLKEFFALDIKDALNTMYDVRKKAAGETFKNLCDVLSVISLEEKKNIVDAIFAACRLYYYIEATKTKKRRAGEPRYYEAIKENGETRIKRQY